ncbi:fatty acid desaturase [Pelagibius sp. Alg239-R121]|uniref:fatty acid desaturase family protein n=1 Tax=Pelagibius sp. Alg239-R121 TaxID=2993448 RepID=UPI0024A6D397|nr:fatty acid desaturase [Pelagibius sp. Alg239-R121]
MSDSLRQSEVNLPASESVVADGNVSSELMQQTADTRDASAGIPRAGEPSVKEMRDIVANLYTPKPWLYWLDFLTSAVIGWIAFALAVGSETLSQLQLLYILIAGLALYRSVCFTHELAHLQKAAVPGFRIAWNALCGIPLLVPDFLYHGIHKAHHNKNRYGTKEDGEYLPFASQAPWHIAAHFLLNFTLPPLSALRFSLLAPLSLLSRPLRSFVTTRASAMALKMDFTRDVPSRGTERKRWVIEETLASFYAAGVVLALVFGFLPLDVALVWYMVLVFVGTMNSLRAVGGTHRYRSDETAMGFSQQIEDSVNVPFGGLINLLLCPVGLRFHALHHLFPGLPYHALGTAHARLMTQLPTDASYRGTVVRSVWAGFAQVWRDAAAGRNHDAHPGAHPDAAQSSTTP